MLPAGGLVGGDVIYGSVCSGVEAASLAWEPLGWECAFLSEIAPFPRAVLSHRYPDVPLRGDFTEIARGDHADIDLLVGGTPCQSFSVAGLRGGLDDDRGNLALEYLRLAERLRPAWLVWENVPGVLSSGGGRDFGAFLGGLAELGYGWAYRVLDAQYIRVDGYGGAVPQRRRRVLVVGCAGGAWNRAAAVLFERASMQGHPPPRREAGQGVARGAAAGPGGGGAAACLTTGTGRRYDAETETLIPEVAGTLCNEGRASGSATQQAAEAGLLLPEVAHSLRAQSQLAHREDVDTLIAFHGRQDPDPSGDVTHPLDTDGHSVAVYQCHGSNVGPMGTLRAGNGHTTGGVPFMREAGTVRRLTPRECERLQGIPDDWTLVPYRGRPAKDGPRYAAIGNSMAVNVMRWLGRRIARVEALP